MSVDFDNPVNPSLPVNLNVPIPKTEKEILNEILTPLLIDPNPTDPTPLPQIPNPGSVNWLAVENCSMPPTVGSTVLASIVNFMSDQKQANMQARYAEGMAIVEDIHEQAKIMKNQAAMEFAMTMVCSFLTIAGSVIQIAGNVKTARMKAGGGTGADKSALAAQKYNETLKFSAINETIKGAGQALNGLKEFLSAGYNVRVKNLDAEIEKARVDINVLDNLTDTLKEVIRNAIAAQNSIQSGTNQTKSKLLA